MEGTIEQIQREWDALKSEFNFSGQTLKFFKATGARGCFCISDYTPVKTMVVS
tara:strand:- start:69844 stop:70002 length:159 start_codon:yes stop_codon:yes gene_type:complete